MPPSETFRTFHYQEFDPKRTPLSEAEIEEIAEKAAIKAISKLTDHVYQEVGKGIVSKALYLIGAGTIGIYLWLKSKGFA